MILNKSAACMDIHIGAALDPKETQGLAHFLEHMLFMGTEKYPEENAYSKFISENGGNENAFTTLEDTNFHFDIANESFEKALDMFAQFFICPLFSQNSVEKEMKAVDSEFRNALQSDADRYFQLYQHESNPDNVFNRFINGSIETLKKEGIVSELKEFHAKWYSSNLMKLCIYSNKDLDDMETIVRDLFAQVENKNIEVPSFSDPPAFTPEHLGKFYRVKSVCDENELGMSFNYPWYGHDYYYEVMHYASHILGHEGANSLLSALIQKDLATDISVSYDHFLESFSYLDINIVLTENGFDHYEDVIELVWAKINALKQELPKEYIFNEYHNNCRLAWQFYEKNDAYSFVTNIAERMHKFTSENMKDVQSTLYLYQGFNQGGISKMLEGLLPQNCVVNLYSQNHGKKLSKDEKDETSEGEDSGSDSDSDDGIEYLKEPWYGVKYLKEDFSPELLEKMTNPRIFEDIKLADPCTNVLFPDDLSVIPSSESDSTTPNLIANNKSMEVWNLKCTKYNIPTVIVTDNIYTSDCNFVTSVEGMVFSQIWIKVIKEYFREYSYMAEQAGLIFSIGFDEDSLEIFFKGYSDRIEEFIYTCMNKLKSFDVSKSERIFLQKKEAWLKDKRNLAYDDPSEQLELMMNRVMISNNFNTQHQISVGEEFTFERFVILTSQFLQNGKHLWFSIGNILNCDALRISQKVLEILDTKPMSLEEIPPHNLFNLQENKEVHMLCDCENSDEENSAVMCYFQYGIKETDIDYLMNCMMLHMLEEPTYDYLRTKEQLGYLVYCKQWNYRSILGGAFVIQSSKQPPEYLIKQILKFIDTAKQLCESLSDEDFTKAVTALLSDRKQPEINLATVKYRVHSEICSHQYKFNRIQDEIAMLEDMIKDEEKIRNGKDMLKNHFYKTFIDNVKILNLEMTSDNLKEKQEENYKSNNETSRIPRASITLANHEASSVPLIEQTGTSNLESEIENEPKRYTDLMLERWKQWCKDQEALLESIDSEMEGC